MSRVAATVVLVVVLLFSPAVRAVEPAGTVVRLIGSAVATMSNGFARPLYVGSTILVGDRVDTTVATRIQMRMSDGSVLTLGENSSMTVDIYGREEDNGFGLLKVVSGVFLAASGALAKLGPNRYVIETPSAVLGVRGTEVWGRLNEGDRLEVALLSGTGVTVTTPLGTVEMTEPNSGITIVPGEAPPEPKPWGDERLSAARQAVSFE
jgi:Uncharacterized protein conserved in bacteria